MMRWTLCVGLTRLAAIEKKTSPPGSQHYRGWHNPVWALLFYTRTAQVDAAAWETGFAVMAAAIWRDQCLRFGVGLGMCVDSSLGAAAVLCLLDCVSDRCRFLFRSFGRTRTTTRGMGWSCCLRWRCLLCFALAWLEQRWSVSQPLKCAAAAADCACC